MLGTLREGGKGGSKEGDIISLTFSTGETEGGVGFCWLSDSSSQFLRASSSHSACILSQNSVSDCNRTETLTEPQTPQQ